MGKIILLALLAVSLASADVAATQPEKHTITADGKERTYYTFESG